MDLSTRAVVTACFAALVAVAAYFGTVFLVAVCLALVAALAYGWPLLLDLPGALGARLVVALGGFGAIAAAALTNGTPALQHVPIVLAACIVVAFVAELARGDGRTRLLDSLIGTVSGAVVAVSCSGWIAAAGTRAGTRLVVAAAIALAVASAVSAVRWPTWTGVVATVALAVAAAGGVGMLFPDVSVISGVVAGTISGLLVAALRALFDKLPGLRGRWAALAAAALPVAVGGTLIFFVARVLVG